MKTLRFSRRQIFRAIQAACIALFFAACGGQAIAQNVGPGFTSNGSNVTGSGTHSGTYFSDGSTNGYAVTIQAGANLQNSGSAYSNLIRFDNGSVTNSGSLYGNNGSGNNAIYIGRGGSPGAAGTGVTLNGSVNNTASGYIYGTHSAVYMWNNTVGGISNGSVMNVTNAGTLAGDTSSSAYAVGLFGYNASTTGNLANTISINNASTGSIYGDHAGILVYNYSDIVAGNINNAVSLTNSGSVYNTVGSGTRSSYSGAYFSNNNYSTTGNVTSSISVNNTNSIYGSYSGVYADNYNSDTGMYAANSITVTNTGSMTSSDYYGVRVRNESDNTTLNATNTFILNNTGSSATISGYYAGVTGYNFNDTTGGNASNTASLTNSGTIFNTSTTSNNSSYSGLYFYNENKNTTGNAANILTLNNTGASASLSGYYAGAYVYNYNENTTGNASNALTVNNSGAITGSGYYGLYAYNDNNYTTGNTTNVLTLNNTGASSSISGYYGGVYAYNDNYNNGVPGGDASNTLTLTNSGTITSTSNQTNNSSDSGAYLYNDNEYTTGNAVNTLTVNNASTGNITGSYAGVYAYNENYDSGVVGKNATNTLTVNNSGSMTGSHYGLYAYNENEYTTGNATNTLNLNNSGTITGSSRYGLYAYNYNYRTSGNSSNSLTFTNSGTVTGHGGYDAVYLYNEDDNTSGTSASSVYVNNTSTGVISTSGGSSSGLYVYNSTSGSNYKTNVTNAGTISGSGYGVYFDSGNSSLLTKGGMISGGSTANYSVYLNGGNSSVTVQGRTNMVGIIEGGNYATNSLTLDLAFVSPAEAATANASNLQATGDIVVNGDRYHWQDFTGANVTVNAVSAETVVDSGLKDIATKLDNNVLASPDYDALYAAGAVSPEAALNSLTGREFLDAFTQIGLSNATQFGSQADSRAFALRSGSTGLDFTALNLSPSTMIASLGNMENALSRMSGTSLLGGTSMSDSKDDKAMISSDSPRWGAWAAGTVTFADQSSTSTTPGYNATSGSPTFGIDYRVCPELVVGALFNYTTGGVNFADSSNLDTDTYLGGIYVDWTHKGWFVNGLAAGGITDYHQNRATLGGAHAQASPSGGQELVTLSTGYDFKTGGFVISPEFGLQYTHLNKDAFSESGAGAFDLNVGEQDVNSLRTKLGLNLSRPFTFSGVKYVPQMNAFWYHECLDVNNGVSNSLPGAPGVGSFVVQPNSEGRDFALVGAGLNATPDSWHGNVSFFANYEAQVGQASFMSNTVDGGVRIGF